MAGRRRNSQQQPMQIKRAEAPIDIHRDEFGVPHIQAVSWLDVLFALGYMHARDRVTQVLFSRTIASGRAAERIADRPQLIETDRFFRRVGLHLNLEEEVEALDDLLARAD